jgi:NAD+ synthetase
MKSIAIAQLNPTVGDLAGNAEKILAAYEEGTSKGANLTVCPELCLIGYPPEDLVLMPAFRKEAMAQAKRIAAATKEAGLIFGTLWEENGAVYNAAIFAAEGRIQLVQHKTMLPNYGVFDERRIFTSGSGAKTFHWQGKNYALLICEDVWHTAMVGAYAKEPLDGIIVINASPYERGKLSQRKQIVGLFAQNAKTPVMYVNLVGAQDDIIFDGASFVMGAAGYVTEEYPSFQEGVFVEAVGAPHSAITTEENMWWAMKLGLANYVRKNNFQGVLLGISGGIDSAVSTACAVDALGKENVRGVLLPSPYTSEESNVDALALAKNLGIQTETIYITPMMQTYEQVLSDTLGTGWMEEPLIGGNLQARIRGQVLMALSNKTGLMLLTTGNKSELAVGYSTLYGDSCGGYNVIKDVYKTEVYNLAKWRNSLSPVIPENSITRAPSAELKPNQKDEDQLPPYSVLDAILMLHIEERKSHAEIVAQGFDEAVVAKVLALVRTSEYKRRQSAPGVKLSPMMFSRDRRYPMTNKF